MTKERLIKELPLDQCPDTTRYMIKHTGIDPDDVPEIYGDTVTKIRDLLIENLKLFMVFQCYDILEKSPDKILLENGQIFTGKMAPRILADASQVVCYVVTLAGSQELSAQLTDIMDSYFSDIWGTVYVEAGEAWLKEQITALLSDSGLRRTHSWNPGQHQFELINQRPLFELLKPEEIGCSLTSNLFMNPTKTTSGIVGLVPMDIPEEKDLLPCDFCSLSKTCPASRSKHGN
ncbi:MAG: hypothetical protein Q4B70_01915 [Lachnospiraceae bacterium]|nr:hypothetical protein [Lachnospiraceae bacterium]